MKLNIEQQKNVTNLQLHGRTALVTGGGRGIGKSISLTLAGAGCDVAISYNRDHEAAEETREEVQALGRKSAIFQVNVEDHNSIDYMIKKVQTEFGHVCILINNAGIASQGKSVVDTGIEEVMRVIAVNAVAAHHLCRLTLPAMRKFSRSDIVMVSSAVERSLRANSAPYSMSKSALNALARVLAKEERKYNVRVNIVAPGLVETEMGIRLVHKIQGVTDIRELDSVMPWQRVCQPIDVAKVVLFLVSEQNSYMTGECLYVDGGRSQ